jgi:hypothetical protein
MKKLQLLRWITMAMSFCAVATCVAAGPSDEGIIWWAPDLHLVSLADISKALSEPVLNKGNEVSAELSNGSESRTVRNCSEYLAAIDLKMFPSNELGFDTPFIERCYALRYLSHVSPAKESYIETTWSSSALKVLPPFDIFVEAAQEAKAAEARAAHESWAHYNQDLKVVELTPRTLTFQDSINRWVLTVVAEGDFNNDGFNDMLVIACNGKRTTGGGFCFPAVFTAYGPGQVMSLITSPSLPYHIQQSATQSR